MDPTVPPSTDWQGIVLVISAIGTVITGIIASLANYNASRAKVASDQNKLVSESNSEKLVKIEAQTNSLTHAVTAVAQTDANARLEAAKGTPVAPVVAPLPVEIVNPEPVRVTQTAKERG